MLYNFLKSSDLLSSSDKILIDSSYLKLKKKIKKKKYTIINNKKF